MPLEFADCVRVSLVASETRVTLVSVSAPPEESVTVPVIPPSVCCAKEYGESTRLPRTKKKTEEKKKFRLLIIRNVTPEIQRDRGVGTDFFITRPVSLELKAGTAARAASFGTEKPASRRVTLLRPIKGCKKNRTVQGETETHSFAGTNQEFLFRKNCGKLSGRGLWQEGNVSADDRLTFPEADHPGLGWLASDGAAAGNAIGSQNGIYACQL